MNAMSAVKEAQNGLASYLAEVERHLESTRVDSAGPALDKGDTLMAAARHLCLGGGGKRARPMLTRMFGEMLGIIGEPLVELGVVAELIHSASLLHDDVVDAGMFRRGRPTVNARYGNIVAVMAGDLLLCSALRLLKAFEPSITHDAIATVMEMTRAAIFEVEVRADLSLPVERLRYIHEGKTGALFAFCGTAPARLTGDTEAMERFAAFGRRLGVAFQIADDCRDLTDTDAGKPQYADIQSRCVSLPILLAAQKDDALRRRLKDAWAFSAMNPDRVRELGTAVLASGALDASLERMHAEIDTAIDVLGKYGEQPGGAELIAWAYKLAQSVEKGKAT